MNITNTKMLCCLLLISWACHANAMLISSYSRIGAGGGTAAILTGFNFSFAWNGGADVFASSLNESNLGERFSFSSGADFDFAATFLGNGIADDIIEIRILSGSTTQPESFLFAGFDPFSQYNITAFDIVIDDVTFDTPGSDPNGSGIWTEYTLDYTLELYGTEVNRSVSEAYFSGVLALALIILLSTGKSNSLIANRKQ